MMSVGLSWGQLRLVFYVSSTILLLKVTYHFLVEYGWFYIVNRRKIIIEAKEKSWLTDSSIYIAFKSGNRKLFYHIKNYMMYMKIRDEFSYKQFNEGDFNWILNICPFTVQILGLSTFHLKFFYIQRSNILTTSVFEALLMPERTNLLPFIYTYLCNSLCSNQCGPSVD